MKNKGARWLSAFLISAFAFAGVFLIIASVYTDETRRRPGATVVGSVPRLEQALVLSSAQASTNSNSPAPVYRHSVIPGGVRQSSELTSVLMRDRFAKVHYANFVAANARIVHVKAPRLVHVSYRLGNEIYWTKKKVRLSSGETLLTDGKSFVRTRCGNRIADTPQPMVFDKEPAPEELDTVIATPGGALNRTGKTPNDLGQIVAPINGLPDRAEYFGVPPEAPILGVLPPPLPAFPTPLPPLSSATNHCGA